MTGYGVDLQPVEATWYGYSFVVRGWELDGGVLFHWVRACIVIGAVSLEALGVIRVFGFGFGGLSQCWVRLDHWRIYPSRRSGCIWQALQGGALLQ